MKRAPEEVPDDVLEEVGRLLSSSDGGDQDGWFDGETLRVSVVSRDLAEQLDDEDDARLPEWKRQERERMRQIHADTTDRYLPIPIGRTGSGRLHTFVHDLSDRALAEEVRDAMSGGRGAYRRVRDLLYRQGALDLWHRFEEAQNRKDALHWLREVGLVADDPPAGSAGEGDPR